MRKKLLVVGAGFGQLPAIEKAKQMGLEVITVDRNPEALGMKLADHSYPVDIIYKEGVLEIAEMHQINGIMTMQSDLPVPTIGFINDKLGLNGVSLQVANNCSHKIEMRMRLTDRDCDQPKYKVTKTEAEILSSISYIGLPCVIKAPNSSGSRGIVKVNEIRTVRDALSEALSYSRGNEVLVEEYISGLEFGAQTFSEKGECILVLMHNDTISKPPYMIPVGHSFPFNFLSQEEREVFEQDIKRAVNAIGIQEGPANVDLILDENTNAVKIIEIGARIGATCLPELVTYHTGIDWVKAAISNSIGEKADLTLVNELPVAALIIESLQDGKFHEYSFSTNIDSENLLEFEVTAKKGEVVSKLRKGTDRIGKVIVKGETVLEAEKAASHFVDNLRILINE